LRRCCQKLDSVGPRDDMKTDGSAVGCTPRAV
jgi:hypothetical protein